MKGKLHVSALAEEFTDYILVDESRDSVVIHIKENFFKTIFTEYKKMGYKLVHVSRFNEDVKMTCVFVRDQDNK